MSLSNKQKVIALLKSFETKSMDSLVWLHPHSYIQHNLRLADGVDGLRARLETLPDGVVVNIMRIFEDGDYVFAHSEYNFGSWRVGIDIFRFENGLIVEHWDNLQAKERPDACGHTISDGPIEAVDLDRTAANKEIVRSHIRPKYEKIHLLLGQGNFVLAVSEGRFMDLPFAFFDLYRVEKGEIAEHWEVMEEIPPIGNRKNGNGKF